MKILYVNDEVKGGGAEYILEILLDYFRKENEVAIASSSILYPTDFFLPTISKGGLSDNLAIPRDDGPYLALYRAIKKFKPDLIHFNNILRVTPSVIQIAREMNVPFLSTMHGMEHICPETFWVNGHFCEIRERSKCKCLTYQKYHRRLEYFREVALESPIVVYSENMKKDMVSFGFREKDITVIPNGINPKEVPGNTGWDKHIMWTGSEGIKGKELIWGTLGMEKKNFKLHTYSYFPMETLDSYYVANPFVPKRRFLDDLGNSSGLLYTSFYPYPGLVALEAMACSKPIIAFKNKNQEVLELGGTLVTNPDPKEIVKSVEYLIDNEEIGRTMGEINRKAFETYYTSDIMGKKYEEIYKKVIG